MTAARRRALPRRLRGRDPRDRHGVGRARRLSTGPASRSSSRRCIRATAARSASACMAELCRACRRWRVLARALRHRPQHRCRGSRPARALARPARARSALDPELAGWNGIGFVVQAYQKRCPFVIDWLVDLARRSGRRLMVRLVKGAYWDSEIKRAQVDGLDGYPGLHAQGRTPTSPTSPARGSCSRRPTRSIPQFATHNAHTLAAIHELAGGLPRRPVRVPVPARHGRAALRAGRRPASKLGPAVPHLRAGRHARDAARLPGAPPARERRQHLVRQPHRRSRGRRSTSWSPIRSQRRGAPRPAGRAASRDPAAARALRRRAREFARASISPNERDSRALADGACGERASAPGAPRRCSARPATLGDGAQPVRNPADRDDVVGSVREATPDDVDAAVALRRAQPRAWLGRRRRAERAACLERAADLLEARMPRCIGAARARGRQDAAPTPSPRCARRSTSCATTRRRRARGFDNAHAPRRSGRSSASARGISRWRSSPARSPRRSPPATRCSPSRPSRRR